jgi:hypothetical protein
LCRRGRRGAGGAAAMRGPGRAAFRARCFPRTTGPGLPGVPPELARAGTPEGPEGLARRRSRAGLPGPSGRPGAVLALAATPVGEFERILRGPAGHAPRGSARPGCHQPTAGRGRWARGAARWRAALASFLEGAALTYPKPTWHGRGRGPALPGSCGGSIASCLSSSSTRTRSLDRT